MKLCTVCGVVTSRAGSRCTDHARQSNRSRHNALYSTRAWQRLSARVLRAWRGEHGNWCPGYQRELALPEKVAVARPTGYGRVFATYEIPIEGRDEWVAAAGGWR